MNKKLTQGFTLIELLVVIAIIGILASVVLASLSVSRDKAKSAAVQSSVSSFRAQAEIYGAKTNGKRNYAGMCATTGATADPTLVAIRAAITAKTGAGTICRAPATGNPAVANAWAFQTRLVGSPTEYLCVDSTGRSTISSATQLSTTVTSDVACDD